MTAVRQVTMTVNGTVHELTVEPRTLLADALRGQIGMTGTRLGCEHGVCGACTVLVQGEPVRSCLMLAIQAAGRNIETIESLERPDGSLDDLQQRFHEHHALQCGFCTSGILMSLTALFRASSSPTESQIRDFIQGHICRCTGYQQIVEAALELAAISRETDDDR